MFPLVIIKEVDFHTLPSIFMIIILLFFRFYVHILPFFLSNVFFNFAYQQRLIIIIIILFSIFIQNINPFTVFFVFLTLIVSVFNWVIVKIEYSIPDIIIISLIVHFVWIIPVDYHLLVTFIAYFKNQIRKEAIIDR